MECWKTGHWAPHVRIVCFETLPVFTQAFSVDVNITSIATYLPSSTENENAPFAGTTNTYPNLTPAEESAFRADQAQKQEEDAEARNIAWNADDEDGEADDDPDYVRQPDGTYVEISKLAERQQAPVGVRNGDGVIQELFPSMDVDEALYGGVTQPIPQGLGALNDMVSGLAPPDLPSTRL